MRVAFFFLLVSFCSGNLAQIVTITGKCIDKKGAPIPEVKVLEKKGVLGPTKTNDLGQFSLSTTFNDTLDLIFTFQTFVQEVNVIVGKGPTQTLPPVLFQIQMSETVVVQRAKEDPFTLIELPKIDLQRMISVEKYLTLTQPATSNNELTSNYNVRGGNYDENLVYVNGFLVYRPFLNRSGQQEGMSFIHSALVESVKFSAGGFDAQYGDRLSSVLDITYNRPSSFRSSVAVGLLSEEGHVEGILGKRFTYLAGARYRANGYLLNSLPTKGAYNPVFSDGQFLGTFTLNPKLTWSLLAHYSSNNYRFAPQTSNTDFGTANEAYSFRIYFDGQESTRFQTGMIGTKLRYTPTKQTNLDLFLTGFQSDEREYFDIQGQYYINELETDPSQEEYGDSIAVLGIGTFLNHARNRLNAQIMNIYHEGSHQFKADYVDFYQTRFAVSQLKWGVGYEYDQFNDVLSEWKMIDSAGYSVPQGTSNEVELFETIKSNLTLENHKGTGYLQWNYSQSKKRFQDKVNLTRKIKENGVKRKISISETLRESTSKWALSVGTRAGYTSVNQELFVTPRFSLSYFPRAYMVKNNRIVRRNLSYRFAAGTYYQPPFYREFRTYDGNLNTHVQSQKSLHAVIGSDLYFNLWKRDNPFKFSGEIFFKYLWDVNPYEIENVRTRYYAHNEAFAYATGLDFNLHGEFVPGVESFFKVGILQTRENLRYDSYKEYYNASGDKIIFGFSEDQVVVDSATFFPGFIPRPTDQVLTVGALVQDQMPGLEDFTVQMGLQYGAPLPYGPPGQDRYRDVLRMKAYFRVDLGFSYNLAFKKAGWWRRHVSESMVSLEIFNLLGVNNVLSKQWIQDVEGKFYSIPNYLTQRLINLKFICRFN
ncbi:MAG: TonB-dependent receptor plug domain-containing protein [Bacteroidetes bacterium]|nr:TonB-dependent receptor plug domain-containing protein [Bacteroidota bacterium]MBM3424036.1 TonB-dependent receptor [Bacteroidota bacterium]